ncbi:hypothetical protein N658DRAFT_492400 [Parathielavia hyrcaniae]|uniref:Uncharacterized protein n=1 Tax=Parathielavia hyrcaniae TaxID=113614 RepID=A0AAN6Q969_9PEZI|nr:hypothetical protein N658DRAFT_492400 [Parathielavia hyrcaniae]
MASASRLNNGAKALYSAVCYGPRTKDAAHIQKVRGSGTRIHESSTTSRGKDSQCQEASSNRAISGNSSQMPSSAGPNSACSPTERCGASKMLGLVRAHAPWFQGSMG